MPAPEHTQPDESEPTTIKRRSIPTWKPILAAVVVLLVFVAVIGPLRPDVIGYGDATDALTDTSSATPSEPSLSAYNSAVSTALSDATQNEASATGAPQQTVVNGWLIRDLMQVQIDQANDALTLQYESAVNGEVTRDLMQVQIDQANDALVLQYVMVIGLFVVVTLLWAGRRRPGQSRDDLPSVSQRAAEEAAHKSPGT